MTLAWAVSSYPVLARVPNDTYFEEQWHLAHIGAPKAWDTSLGFEGIPIAILDSGVDLDHPDLKDNIWRNTAEIAGNGIDDDGNGYADDVHGWDFVSNDANPEPDISGDYSVIGANHGTVDAGIAAARGDNGRGIAGAAWQASIMPLRVLDARGSGDPHKVVRAVEYAVNNGARVINLSFAGTSYNAELAIALRRAYDKGVFVVAAAGNAPDGGDAADLDVTPLYPICFDLGSDENFVFGIAATDTEDRRAPFSNFGAGCTDLSAPGTRMLSTQLFVPGHKYFDRPYGGFYNGTSLAAAAVSGAAALIFALDHHLTPKQVANILVETSKNIDAQNPGQFGKVGRGRVDVAAAVARITERRKQDAAPVTLTSSLLPPGADGALVFAAPAFGAGRNAEVRVFTPDGTYVRSFLAYPEGFRGGVSLAAGSFGSTGGKSVVTGAGPGGAPQVRVFDVNTRAMGTFLAYDSAFRGGVHVTTADVDGDGVDEIITGAGSGGGPHVRVFRSNGRPMGGFFAGRTSLRTGVWVEAADLDGDGKDEIITRTAANGPRTAWRADGTVVAAAGAVNAASVPARAFGAGRGSLPMVSVLRGGSQSFGFQAFESSYRGGVNAALVE